MNLLFYWDEKNLGKFGPKIKVLKIKRYERSLDI